MRKEIKQKIEQQYFFDGISPKRRLLDDINKALSKSARLGKNKALLQMVLGHFAAHINQRGRLPRFIKMKRHHWELLRKAGRKAGVATNKAHEGCSVMGVPVQFT